MIIPRTRSPLKLGYTARAVIWASGRMDTCEVNIKLQTTYKIQRTAFQMKRESTQNPAQLHGPGLQCTWELGDTNINVHK